MTRTFTCYMAPTPHKQDLTTNLFSSNAPNLLTTMSSPNLNAASILRNQSTRTTNSFSSASTNLSGMKTVYVGKDQHPVTIMQMAHVNEVVWKKAASFENLCNTAHSLLDAHSTADIMALIAKEIPMDTGAAFQEAQAAAKVVTDNVFNIDNLHPNAFLNSDGKMLKFAPTVELSERPEDLTFFRFQCDLDGQEVDKRVTMAGDFSFQFCLRLPQHLFNVTDNTVEDISVSPGKKREGEAKTMEDFWKDMDGYGTPTKQVLFGDEENKDEEDEAHILNEDGERDFRAEVARDDAKAAAARRGKARTLTSISPKFKGMVGKNDKAHRKGYYGQFLFLNSQYEFHKTFGNKPVILPSNPMQANNTGVKDKLREYSDKCKLDIYLNLCEQDYVGDDFVDNALNSQEICRAIGELRQEWKSAGGRTQMDTPDEIFNKYLQLATSLPSDALSWPIQLCSSYFAALTPELAERMTTDSFRMPSLVMLNTKAKQLEALRLVRKQAASSYKSLEEERSRMTKLMKQMSPHRGGGGGRGSSYATSSAPDDDHYEDQTRHDDDDNQRKNSQVYFQRGPSLAESTIERYKGPPATTPTQQDRPEVQTKLCRETGLQHPYDSQRDYLSKYPLGFRGCYACGGEGHRNNRDCPKKLSGTFNKEEFFLELWAHKPHTKRPSWGQNAERGQSQYAPAQSYRTSTNENTNTNTRNHNGSRNDDSRHGHANQNNEIQHGSRTIDSRDGHANTNQNNEIQNGSRNVDSRYGPANQNTTVKSEGNQQKPENHYGPRNVNNDPAWMQSNNGNGASSSSRQDDQSKKPRLFVYAARVFAAHTHHRLRHMPLDLDNGLPAIEIRFGLTSTTETCFACHVDSCAAMNTGNLLLHEWIMTTYPEIVCSYEQFDDENPFEPLRLACAVSIEDVTATYGQLTSIVTYHTQYKNKDGDAIKLSFGLGAEVAVNAIIGLPTLRKWGASIDIGKDTFITTLLDLSFPLLYKGADSGLPSTVKFDGKDFVRPRPVTAAGRAFVIQTDDSNEGITDSSRFEEVEAIVDDDTSKGYMQRQIEK